jgi:hypothetical protein
MEMQQLSSGPSLHTACTYFFLKIIKAAFIVDDATTVIQHTTVNFIVSLQVSSLPTVFITHQFFW